MSRSIEKYDALCLSMGGKTTFTSATFHGSKAYILGR